MMTAAKGSAETEIGLIQRATPTEAVRSMKM